LFMHSIRYFKAQGLRWLALGAGSGVDGKGSDGLSRFKQGWSTDTRTVYFCGRIFDREKYVNMVNAGDRSRGDYFPAYRGGEFS